MSVNLIQEQKEIAKKQNAPMFAPKDGRCYSCGKYIVNEDWEKKLITGCPLCSKSFCD